MKKISLILALITLIFSFGLVFSQKAEAVSCESKNLFFVKFGERSKRVKAAQACFIKMGYNIPYGATGFYGKQTREAVKNFYADILGINWSSTFGPKGISAAKKVLLSGLVTEANNSGIVKFSNEEEFKYYLAKSRSSMESFGGIRVMTMVSENAPQSAEKSSADRISGTNVQVAGIDEPDILKIDAERIYFSPEKRYYIMEPARPMDFKIMPPPIPDTDANKTKIFKAFPPGNLAEENKIEGSGELLLLRNKKILVVLENNQIRGYSLSVPEKPEKKWDLKFEDNNFYVTARLFNEKIYLVIKNYINKIDPCPIKILPSQIIQCGEIYHSRKFTPIDTTFTSIVINPENGLIENKISFAGSGDNSVIYMSENSLYITYVFNENLFEFTLKALEETNNGLIPDFVMDKILKLKDLEISEDAKLFEYNKILEDYYKTLDKNEAMRVQIELSNRFTDYFGTHARELTKTGIVKINLDDMKISANGNIPGVLLNQFSLDEYNGNLRAAVTVGENRGFGFWFNTNKTANDVYVLNNSLSIIGEIRDLGIMERVYSARFIKDKGYLVTFKQIDPFYVLDLSNPLNPQSKGELKIPGYSSYLEPLEGEKILGVGQDNFQLKVSLFDVSDPQNPGEKDKYVLNEGWSEVLNNHKAFLKDEKHKMFFLPGGNGGYVFSYKDDKISLLKTVSGYTVKRAAYFNDYMYVVGEDKITVLDENNWEIVKEISH